MDSLFLQLWVLLISEFNVSQKDLWNTELIKHSKTKQRKVQLKKRLKTSKELSLTVLLSCLPLCQSSFHPGRVYFRGCFIGYTWIYKMFPLNLPLILQKIFVASWSSCLFSEATPHIVTLYPSRPDLCHLTLPSWPFSKCPLLVPKRKNVCLAGPLYQAYQFFLSWDRRGRKHLASLIIGQSSDWPLLHTRDHRLSFGKPGQRLFSWGML